MTDEKDPKSGKPGFLDSLARLFHRGEHGGGEGPGVAAGGTFAAVEAGLEAALQELHAKLEAQKREAGADETDRSRRLTGEELAAELRRRTDAAHRAMRADIEKMHVRLETGVSADDLSRIARTLEELQAGVEEGKDSFNPLARGRCAIALRLQSEAGRLAADDLVRRLEGKGMRWPDPMSHHPSATPEEIEADRRRRLREVRELFLSYGFQRTAERMLGIVRGWGSDYPARGSALWEESVLEGVAAGIRGKLLAEFVETLRRDRGEILAQVDALVGKDLEALQASLRGGPTSLEQASRAAGSALRVLDEVVPQIAWERVCAQLPQARGTATS